MAVIGNILGGTEMGQKNGIWFCDVCDGSIPAGQKRYPLDAGRICCAACWAEVKGTLADKGACAPEVKRSEESKHITLNLFGESSRAVEIGGLAGMVIGLVVGPLLGIALAWGIYEGDADADAIVVGGAFFGVCAGGLIGYLVGSLFGYIADKPEKPGRSL